MGNSCGIYINTSNSVIEVTPQCPEDKLSPPPLPPPPPPLLSSPTHDVKSPHPSLQEEAAESITILHFNDVYNIEGRSKDPVGGAARFKTALDQFRHLDPLTFFSGDALSPSNISVVMEGVQMVPVLNSLNIQCAVYGNHDFDFGVDHLVSLAGEMNFPWLMSNVRNKQTGLLLADGKEKLVITWHGWKIGLIGLVEMEWIETLGKLEPEDLIYTDFVESARTLVPQLQHEGCDLIVALTHMRVPNDLRLAREVPELHMILGGHDHHYEKRMVGDVLMLKSGSEFREFSQLTISLPPKDVARLSDPRLILDVTHHEVRSEISPHPEMEAIVKKYLLKVEEGLEEVIGQVECCLEGRFKHVRTKETNLGNLVADIMRQAMKADIALLNSGTLRSDSVHDQGIFKMKDLLLILPIVDSVVLLELTGQQLIAALENGVSHYPRHEGRFPQVSGVSFTFDPTQPSGSRVLTETVMVCDKPLEDIKTYKLCSKGYIGQHGKDGYDIFKQCKILVPEDEGPILSSIVRSHFEACYKACYKNCKDDIDGVQVTTRTNSRINPKVDGRITSYPLSESSGSE